MIFASYKTSIVIGVFYELVKRYDDSGFNSSVVHCFFALLNY